MYEEQKMMAAGVPFSEALGLCAAQRRAEATGHLEAGLEDRHTCKCGGTGNCQDCPNKKR